MLNFLQKDLTATKDEIQLGRTKLFIKRPEILQAAEEMREQKTHTAAKAIQVR